MRVLASCDSRYFLAFARIFYTSAITNGYTPIINVINPTKEVKEFSAGLENIHFTEETNNRYEFYASHRFIIAPKHIEDGLLIADIDSVFRKPWERNLSLYDVGFYIRANPWRPHLRQRLAIFAGLVWYNNTEQGLIISNHIKNTLEKTLQTNQEWGIDQTILTETYYSFKRSSKIYSIHQNLDISTNFNKNAAIWPGKGIHKYKDKKYLNCLSQYKKLSLKYFAEPKIYEATALTASKDTVSWHSPDAWLPRDRMKKRI